MINGDIVFTADLKDGSIDGLLYGIAVDVVNPNGN